MASVQAVLLEMGSECNVSPLSRHLMSDHASVQILSGRMEATGNQNGHSNVAYIFVPIK